MSKVCLQNPGMVVQTTKPLSAPQKALRKLGLERPIDLALHLPLRYEDETRVTRIEDTRDAQVVQIEGVIIRSDMRYGGQRQLLVEIEDNSGSCMLRFFNAYPSQQKALSVGKRIRALGEVRAGLMGLTMMHPSVKSADADLPQALSPVYPTSAGLPQAYLRRAVEGGLARADLSETVRPDELAELGLDTQWTLRSALHFLHHPMPDVTLSMLQDRSHPAWRRLKFEELLSQQLSQAKAKHERAQLKAVCLAASSGLRGEVGAQPDLHARLMAKLPFVLTAAQQRVSQEIDQDLSRAVPMHRLLQGDVGAGKTVVAALAAARCIDLGWQCALMAPTEILASQHFNKLLAWLEPLGVKVAWLTGSQKAKERREMLAMIASGEAQLVIGTHAIIQDKVSFDKLALVIIDEQHRFGVAQRLALRDKTQAESRSAPQIEPHMLMMTATPIPRTLAMSCYADLDISTIDCLPPGRTPVLTKVVSDQRRDEVLVRIRSQIHAGRQVYWVCPLIEESEALDLANATATHAAISAALPDVEVGLLHSRMASADKKAIMARFTQGQMGVLVSTTVIEVGVDVPNASLMVVEHAERFGLSQLHQLRGRVGRGAAASACILLYSTGEGSRLGDLARERLRAMAQTNDGFEIARRDLEIRGPGDFLGARQSGVAMLRFADLQLDSDLLTLAARFAPELLMKDAKRAEQHMNRWLGAQVAFLKA